MNCKSESKFRISNELVKATMKVAVLQIKGDRNDFEGSKAQLIEVIKNAGKAQTRVIVAPECACSEYYFESTEEALPFSETLEGEFAQALSECSITWQIWCFIGVIEKDSNNLLFNSVLITSPTGLRQFYRKRLLFEADELWAQSGDKYPYLLPPEQRLLSFGIPELEDDLRPPYPLFNIDGWRVTVGICMDLNDIRFLNFCVQADVDLIAFPTNWIDQGHRVLNYWATLLQDMKRATLLAANSYGHDGDYVLSGRSAILRAHPATLYGEAPKKGDFIITCTLDYIKEIVESIE